VKPKPDQISRNTKAWFYLQACIDQESSIKNYRLSLKSHDLIKIYFGQSNET
jgi:hypothetical protein